MKIEVGKYYVTRRGKTVGPVRPSAAYAFPDYPYTADGLTYMKDGSWIGPHGITDNDLISEVPPPSPARDQEPPKQVDGEGAETGKSDAQTYNLTRITPADFILSNNLSWLEGCVVDMVTCWRTRGGIAEIEAAIKLLQGLVERETAERT